MRLFIALLLIVLQTSPVRAITVTLKANVNGGDKPTVLGTTNLPEGTELMVELARKQSSYLAQDKVKVIAGAFRAGPFSQKGAGLNPGVYTLEVTMPVAAVQPPSIWPIIGNNGSKLAGPFVKRSRFGGNVVEYRSTFKVGSGATSSIADSTARSQDQADKHVWWLQSCKDTCLMMQGLALKRNETFNRDRCFYKCVADEPTKKQ
jgi:hypothetical protein